MCSWRDLFLPCHYSSKLMTVLMGREQIFEVIYLKDTCFVNFRHLLPVCLYPCISPRVHRSGVLMSYLLGFCFYLKYLLWNIFLRFLYCYIIILCATFISSFPLYFYFRCFFLCGLLFFPLWESNWSPWICCLCLLWLAVHEHHMAGVDMRSSHFFSFSKTKLWFCFSNRNLNLVLFQM